MTKEDFPVFDRDGMLARMGGDASIAEAVLSLFREQACEQLSALRSAIHAGDLRETCAAAHRFKGAAAQVGAEQLRAAAARMEQVARQDDIAEARRLAGSLETGLETFLAAAGPS